MKVLIWVHDFAQRHAGHYVATEAKRQGLDVCVTGSTARPRQMLLTMQEYKPDVVLCYVIRHGLNSYYRAIRRTGAKLVFVYPDMTERRRDRMWRTTFNQVADALIFSQLETAQRYSDLAENVLWMPQYFDHRFCLPDGQPIRRLDPSKPTYDLCFIGSCDKRRHRWLDVLEKQYDCYFARNGIDARREIRGETMAEVYAQSKIAINIQRQAYDNPGPYVTSNRIYNAMGSGAFFISHLVHQLDLVFDVGVHCAMFDGSLRDLQQTIDSYLKHFVEREVIALRGQNQVLQFHTLQRRVQDYWLVMRALYQGHAGEFAPGAFGQWIRHN